MRPYRGQNHKTVWSVRNRGNPRRTGARASFFKTREASSLCFSSNCTQKRLLKSHWMPCDQPQARWRGAFGSVGAPQGPQSVPVQPKKWPSWAPLELTGPASPLPARLCLQTTPFLGFRGARETQGIVFCSLFTSRCHLCITFFVDVQDTQGHEF